MKINPNKQFILIILGFLSFIFAGCSSNEIDFNVKSDNSQMRINPCTTIDVATAGEMASNDVMNRLARVSSDGNATITYLGREYDCSPTQPDTEIKYYVATDGQNTPLANGSINNPWATIGYAISQVPPTGGFSIVVKDGVYEGRTFITRSFADWVTIKAEHSYKAKLTNVTEGSEVFGIYGNGSKKIIVEGFYISNFHPTYVCGNREPNVMVHFESASDIILRNNILYGNNAPGTCNELLKINRGYEDSYPRDIQIKGNLLYGRPSAPGTDLIDAVRAGEIDISDNILFDQNGFNAQSFITLKREAPSDLVQDPREKRFKIYRNVFLNWTGKEDQAFIQLGEDIPDTPQISSALIENNLFVGNSSDSIAAPMQFKDSINISVRANTIVGNLPGGAYGFRVGTETPASIVKNISISNNLFSDHTGTMGSRLVISYGNVDFSSISLDRNLFWNAGIELPESGELTPFDDLNSIIADPLLNTNHSGIILPVWNENLSSFPSGNITIREEFERLANTYARMDGRSPAIDSAYSLDMPADDILGNLRDSSPDIGAFEYSGNADDPEPQLPPAPEGLSGVPGDSKVVLWWDTVEEATFYVVYWGTESESYTDLVNTSSSGIIIEDLIPGQNYFFAVTSFNIEGQSEFSQEIMLTPLSSSSNLLLPASSFAR